MIAVLLIIGTLVTLLLSAISSGSETGVYCLNRVRLRVRSQQGDPAAEKLARMMENEEDLVITTLTGTNLTDYIASAMLTALLMHWQVSEQMAELYTTAILAPLVLVYGGIIPKDLFRRRADDLMYRLAAPLSWAWMAVRVAGVLWLLRSLSNWLLRRLDPRAWEARRAVLPRTRMQRLLIEGAVRGGLTEFQRDTIERVMRMSQMRLTDIMVRRERAIFIPFDIARNELLRIAKMAHFSRLPVYRDDPKHVIGVLNVYDVIMDTTLRPIREYVRPAVFLRAHETVPSALIRLQESHQTMAIVVDNHGAALGLFTIKDLIECVVGEFEAW